MGIVDLIWLAAIVGGAGWLFYRSFTKKSGPCGNCSGCSCSAKKL